MPRPKKAGAPEPKRRSRNGCWPCKTRKVKCDETRPSCVNCQKQNEKCDYSIRLNWEGRGKKKAEPAAGFGQIDLSSDITSAARNENKAGSTATPPSTSQFSFQTQTPTFMSESDSIKHTDSSQTSDEDLHHTSMSSQLRQPSNMSVIDPALMPFPDTMYDGLPGQRYTQSYERYRSPTPESPISIQPSVSRFRQVQENLTSPASDSPLRHHVVSTFLAGRTGPLNVDSPTSAPPFFDNNAGNETISMAEGMGSQRPQKRARYQSSREASPHAGMLPPIGPTLAAFSPFNAEYQASPGSISHLTNSAGTPLTPASNYSDDGHRSYLPKLLSPGSQDSPDLRRLSVNSLLSGPAGYHYTIDQTSTPKSNPESHDWSVQYRDLYTDTTTYGVDRGIKDLDIGKNDDANAISGSSPVTLRDHLDFVLDEASAEMPVEFGFGTHSPAIEDAGYYDKPVAICIPRLLEPLPDKLLENPMNLLYFHHFINHTAGALVPHNCSSNPFKLILPQMAVRDDNLLNLLLAYSASHRARLLRQPEPATRIALWVQGIFSNLRDALDDPSEIISNVNLATAIMLASLEIISPKAFGVAVPWQQHLGTARQMIAARGGPLRMKTASRGDKVASFLWSWFSYLDVLGSLSGGKTSSIASAWILDDDIDDENDYDIDCILGFTSKCNRLLAKIAELARVCDIERANTDEANQSEWKPSEDTSTRAEKLVVDLTESLSRPAKPCTHLQSSGEAAYQWDSLEMTATNEAFHWAGLVHLHRRILGKPSSHSDVQSAVSEIFGALYKVRKGSSAEACLLFPMFTAGCDCHDEKQRSIILERIKSIERNGMTQIHQARTLMEKAWETAKPWETLAAGEFFG